MLQIVQSRSNLGDRGKVELYRLKRAAEVLEWDRHRRDGRNLHGDWRAGRCKISAGGGFCFR